MFANATRLLILKLLSKNDEYYFSSALVRGSDGVLTRGEANVQLAHLESSGLVESVQENDAEYQSQLPGAIRRRKYKITSKGRQEISRLATPTSSPILEPA